MTFDISHFDISHFGVAETLSCSSRLRDVVRSHTTAEALAAAMCTYLFGALVDGADHPACPLIRCYVTHPYASLPADDQAFARGLTGDPTQWPNLKCLTLLGTRGDRDEWNDRRSSRGHRAIPIPTVAMVQKAPMIAQLFLQMGVDLPSLVEPAPELIGDSVKRIYNVFYVGNAHGSAHIPAQEEFVERYGVQSVIGFGGALPWGEHFAVILFSRVHIAEATVGRFRSLALAIRGELLKFDVEHVFAGSTAAEMEKSMARAPLPSPDAVARSRSAGEFRAFMDSRRVDWRVWAILPTSAESARMNRSEATSTSAVRHTPARVAVSARWKDGWLLFEANREQRRLSPIPDEWFDAPAGALEEMCGRATPVPRAADF
jgi:hypothetical protein